MDGRIQRRILAALILALPAAFPLNGQAADESSGELKLELISGPGQVAGVTFSGLDIERSPGGGWQLEARNLVHPAAGPLGSLSLECRLLRLGAAMCQDGQLLWNHPDGEQHAGSLEAADGTVRVRIEPAVLTLEFAAEPLVARFEGLPLSWIPGRFLEDADIRYLEGAAAGTLRVGSGAIELDGRVDGLGLDTGSGVFAAEGISADISGRHHPDGRFELVLTQDAGEWLAGPLYLPPPEHPLRISVRGAFEVDGAIELEHWEVDDPGSLRAAGRLRLEQAADGRVLAGLEADHFEIDLGTAWPRWLEGPAAAAGLAGGEAAGRLRGGLALGPEGLTRLALVVDEVDLEDGHGRFRLYGLEGGLSLRDPVHDGSPALEVDLSWSGAGLHALDLGAARLGLSTGSDGTVRMTRPLHIPVLDGALVVERFSWEDWRGEDAAMELDARIEPVDLASLTRALGWPELGGRLGGRFPGIEFADGVLEFAGGMDVDAFSGRIRVSALSIERPFGTLPALAADVNLERLDLLEVTGAFNFGRMEGLLSGHLNGLRLLDWQPVAFDALIQTHDDAPRRRISQRAVDNLSSLGGAGGGILTGTLLRFFEDFGYRRVGIGCRLSSNICRMDGIRPHESGGYYLVEGRGLPRLDVIGHRRLVDWPRLVSQLIAATTET